MLVNKQRLCAKEAAAYLGLSTSTLAKKRMTGEGPIYHKLGRKVIYDVRFLDEWMELCARTSTSDLS